MRLYHMTFILVIALFIIAASAAWAADEDEQRAVAEKFLRAYFIQDIATVRECIPKSDDLLFAKYPLTSAPKYATARVDERQALLEFTAEVGDSKFPGRGGIIFYREDGVWKVRQVLFYTKVPKLFGLPSKSITKEDRAQEGKVKAVGEDFMKCWKDADMKGMRALWHNWPDKKSKQVKGLSMTDFSATCSSTTWKDPYVSYSVKVTYRWGILSYSMKAKGGLILVKEGNQWKVRANHFIFNF